MSRGFCGKGAYQCHSPLVRVLIQLWLCSQIVNRRWWLPCNWANVWGTCGDLRVGIGQCCPLPVPGAGHSPDTPASLQLPTFPANHAYSVYTPFVHRTPQMILRNGLFSRPGGSSLVLPQLWLLNILCTSPRKELAVQGCLEDLLLQGSLWNLPWVQNCSNFSTQKNSSATNWTKCWFTIYQPYCSDWVVSSELGTQSSWARENRWFFCACFCKTLHVFIHAQS